MLKRAHSAFTLLSFCDDGTVLSLDSGLKMSLTVVDYVFIRIGSDPLFLFVIEDLVVSRVQTLFKAFSVIARHRFCICFSS